MSYSLQEVNATPVRYITDLISEDSWSHLLMDTLAPMGYIKVQNKLKTDCVSQHSTLLSVLTYVYMQL